MKVLLLPLAIIMTLSLPFTACSTESYSGGYNRGFEEGYSKGWQEGYKEGVEKAPSVPSQTQTPSSTAKTAISLGEITLKDADNILNLLPFLPATFEKVDAASEGLSNADLGLGSYFSEVQLFVSDEPFQMIYGAMAIEKSRMGRSSFDALMNDETMIRNLLIENIKQGAIEQGYELGGVDIDITYPNLGDNAFLGEGIMSGVGYAIGVDILWFGKNTVYIMLQSVYYKAERQPLLPIANEILSRIKQYSQ